MKETRFKDTEIGLIPEVWEINNLGKAFDFLPNNTLSRDALSLSGEIKSIHYGDILTKYGAHVDVNKDTIPAISNPNYYATTVAHDGDIMIADTAEDETVGKAVEVINVGTSYVVAGLHTIWLHPKNCESFYVGYLGYGFNATIYHKQLFPLMQGTKVTSISRSAIKKTFILTPPIAEQRKIFSALTSVDDLISALDKLIEKKKSIKQGTMQLLLTGKKRLKGFTDPWVEKSIDEICCRFDNLRVPIAEKLRVKGQTPYYGANGIQDYVEGYTHNGEYILIAEDGANSLSDYPIHYVKGTVWVNNHAHVLQAKRGVALNRFLTYALKTIDYESNIVGSGRSKLNSETMMQLSLKISSSIKEQTAIASILTSMDDEISSLETKKAKYEQIKQGMMQQLLTGKIRLIEGPA